MACRSTPRPTSRAERARIERDPGRAGQVHRADGVGEPFGRPQPQVHGAAARVLARRDAGQQQRGRRPPRVPSGRTGSAARRAPASTHHHDTVGAHGRGWSPCEQVVERAASTVSHCRPVIVATTAVDRRAAPACARRGVGRTSRSAVRDARPAPDRRAAQRGRRGAGGRRRRRPSPAGSGPRSSETRRAAVRLPPPCAKKSSSAAGDRDAEHRRPLLGQPRRRCRSARAPATSARSHARAAATAARRGRPCPTCGSAARRRPRAPGRAPRAAPRAVGAIAAARSKPAGVGRHDVADQQRRARRAGPHRGRRRSHAGRAAAGPSSTSPSSMRRPPTLTWSSARPTNTRPAGSRRTRSPVR